MLSSGIVGTLLLLAAFPALASSNVCSAADVACVTDQDLRYEGHEADDEAEAELLKVSLLQMGVTKPVKSSDEDLDEDQPIELFQEGQIDQGIWDTLGGMLHKAQHEIGSVQKTVLDTIVNQTDAIMDEFDRVVNRYAKEAEEAEMKFIAKGNMSVQEQVSIVQKKVHSITRRANAMWREAKAQVASLQHTIVGTLSTVGQTESAIKLNSTLLSLISSVESADHSAMAVAKDAKALTVDTASCGVLKLNSTLSAATDRVYSFKKDLDSGFEAINETLTELVQKLPEPVMTPSLKAVSDVDRRGLSSSANLLKVYNSALALQISSINKLQAQCLSEGKGCGSGGIFSNIKDFFKKLFHR
eukprot:gb/GFBE01047924.1/.p1 GENE.gb/GFBE01047924.1/~~gb/GFBE01047924.1/.p1  ORF type:complete len:358 (+),score=96.67 gb/GFBE01047924.1/:1-1074(+)